MNKPTRVDISTMGAEECDCYGAAAACPRCHGTGEILTGKAPVGPAVGDHEHDEDGCRVGAIEMRRAEAPTEVSAAWRAISDAKRVAS